MKVIQGAENWMKMSRLQTFIQIRVFLVTIEKVEPTYRMLQRVLRYRCFTVCL